MNTHDDLTTRLHRQLHDQVDGWHDAPLTLESVRGRAHAIRRTRRLAAAGVAAVAVAALAIPAGLVGSGLDRTQRDPAPVDTPTEAVEPTPNPDGTFPLTLEVPEGDVPATGYISVDDRQLVTPDGAADLPGSFVQVLPYADGYVGLRSPGGGQEGLEIVELDAGLEELSAAPAPAFSGIVSSSDGSRLAWVETTGAGEDWTVVNAPADGSAPVRTPVAAETKVEGFLADDRVAFATTDPSTGMASFGETTPEGAFDSRALEGFQAVGGTSTAAGLVVGQTEFTGDSTCSEIRDAGSGAVVVETCDYSLGPISPDGRWVIGYSSYSDNGSPRLAILDAATARPVVEWTSSRRPAESAVVLNAAWDDDDTVVAAVGQVQDQALLTFEANGVVTRASEARQQEMSVEFFPGRAVFGE
jgi:hypothetical protein